MDHQDAVRRPADIELHGVRTLGDGGLERRRRVPRSLARRAAVRDDEGQGVLSVTPIERTYVIPRYARSRSRRSSVSRRPATRPNVRRSHQGRRSSAGSPVESLPRCREPRRRRTIADSRLSRVTTRRLVAAVQETVGDAGPLLHLGLTSSDIVDTALATQLPMPPLSSMSDTEADRPRWRRPSATASP